MEPRRLDLGYSLKNIPIPSPGTYCTRLIEKVESLIKRMRWKAFFFKKGENDDQPETDDHFGFKTRKCPPRIEELEPFEDDLLKMIEDVQFRNTTNNLQQRLRKDSEKIKKSKDIIVPADKTRNLYTVNKAQYDKLLRDNITKSYKPAPAQTYDEINYEASDIADSLGIADRTNCMAKREAFITLKDHKNNFANALPCRLINPAKSEIGIISKSILDRILAAVHRQLPLNMWKNTSAVINWFTKIRKKQRCTFISFDIVDFYPSITEKLLKRALEFAEQFTSISKQDMDIIFHARKSMLFGQGKEWIKRGTGLFDVTMGCFDGAEICELVGTFALATLSKELTAGDIGLYRDDGLGVLWDASGHEADRIRKDIIKIFADLGLKIIIQTNLKVAHFLDVTLNLSTEKYYPYRKPNDRPLYIHRQSNHPPSIIKNIPASISRRLTDISSDQTVFVDAKPIYDNALRESGFNEETQYLAHRKGKAKRKNRQRKIIWFNPPYSQNVATNIGRRFRSLVNKHFPKSSKLHKIFNSNTLKLSYSCMPNMAAVIRQHNNILIRNGQSAPENHTSARSCNCRVKSQCPLDGACLTQSIVYKATIKTEEEQKEYTGLTATTFKQRFNSHQQSMRDRKYQHSTALSKHVWALKDNSNKFSIKWSIHRKATTYQNTTRRCNLCLAEKLAIIKADKSQSLNKRTELVSKCRHENRYYLCNFPPPLT